MSDLIKAILLGIVEGVTEFVPISSTGHMLLVGRWMGIDFEADPFWTTFIVFIQLGAVLAVIVYFRKRLQQLLAGELPAAPEVEGEAAAAPDPRVRRIIRRRWEISLILVATVPVLAVGYLTQDWVEARMNSARVIAWAVLVGGIAMLIVELFVRPSVTTDRMERMTLWQALWIGAWQILAVVFPGTSRSAATIIGGMLAGLSRPAAAEFSFFLAIPALGLACVYKLAKFLDNPVGMTRGQGLLLAIGTAVSFAVAWLVIAAFMQMIRRYSFIPFAVYRIILGIVVMRVLA
jgi:undecaprenyl-diphosphatase